jgi:hypothetical protein
MICPVAIPLLFSGETLAINREKCITPKPLKNRVRLKKGLKHHTKYRIPVYTGKGA